MAPRNHFIENTALMLWRVNCPTALKDLPSPVMSENPPARPPVRQPTAPGPVELIEFDLWETFRTSRTFTTFRISVTPCIKRQLVVSLGQVVVITFLLDVLF